MTGKTVHKLRFKNFKIRQKLILILLVISLIPLLAVSIYNFYYAKSELEKKAIDRLKAVTLAREAHINHFIQLRQEQAKQIAGGFLPRQLRESGLNDPEIVRGIQADINAAFYDLNLEPSGYYKNIDQKTDIEIIGIWDVLGTIIANTNRDLIGKKMPIEYMQNVYKQGTFFGGLEKDPLTGKNFLIILELIRNWRTNEIVGAVSLKIRAKTLNEITTAGEGLGQTGESYIVDKHYRMITPSRFADNAILKLSVKTEGTRACFRQTKAPTLYKNYRDTLVLGVQRYLPDEDWCLVTEINANEAFATTEALRNRTLVIGGLFLFVILFLTYKATESFVQPIIKLRNASSQVAQGDYDVVLHEDSQDEIGELSKVFNEMAKNLTAFKSELEEKNKELFKSLAVSTQQKKELKKVNQELDSFVYTASHDLRAPLRGIASFATFLEEDYKNKLDDEGKGYIDEIRKGATKMNALIEDLLSLSRISRIKNPYEDVPIRPLIDSVLERIKVDIQKEKVRLIIAENLPTVYCDRIKMAEVFLNLINNAIKFSSKNNKDHPQVEIGYMAEDDHHKFFVKDNGIGIDPKYHEQIFGIFKRLHTDKEYEGTGAGLSIIKRVIDDHHGKIWIESKLGQGAAFFFTIPKNLFYFA
ncbi:MAG: ATP-binding protein [Candidatus Omnitrophota bacterium]